MSENSTPPDNNAKAAKLRKDAGKAGICSIDAEYGYSVDEAAEALPHFVRLMQKSKPAQLEHLRAKIRKDGPRSR